MRIFSGLVYLWFIINGLMLWSVKEIVWGPHSVFFRQGQADNVIENFFYNLIYSPERFQVIFYTHLLCALLGIFERSWSFIPRILCWMTGHMLYYAAVQAFNSGMSIMLLMAFYCVVINTKAISPWRIVLNNTARIACMVQLVIVYFVATVYKLSGTQWLEGDAIYYTLQIDYLSSPFWKNASHSFMLMKILSYLALIYQGLFPFLIWIKKGRSWLLLVGVIFHLFIGAVLHLWDFALAMIFCYALFIPETAFWKKGIPLRDVKGSIY